MPGLSGIVGEHATHPISRDEMAAMARCARTLAGTDGIEWEYRDEKFGVSIQWACASRDGECAAWNETRDVLLVFCGRDFDFPEKSTELSKRGPRPSSECEALLRGYEAHGLPSLATINGRFCGVIVDLRSGETHLFNDRFGAARVYVHRAGKSLFFATEARALLAARPGLRRVDPRGLGELLSVGCVLQNRTLFTDVEILPPGAILTARRDGSVHQRRYFDPRDWENQSPLAGEEFCEQLTSLFSRIVPRYHRESGSVAMSMTGGLDSRMILAWSKAKPGELPCYTFGGPYRDCADVRIARRLAALAHQPHHTIPIGREFLGDFPALADRTVELSDGTMDVSGAVELYANRLAREIAPIRLTGNYGSEILRANVAFRPRALDRALFSPEFLPQLDAAAETYRAESAGHRLSFIAFKQVPWHHHARLSIEAAVLEPRSPFLDNKVVALAYRAPAELARSPVPALRTTAAGHGGFAAVATDRAVRLRPAPVIGRLHHEWQEFTAKVEYAWDYGMPGWLVKMERVFRAVHPERLFLGRHKFYHFRVWYRDQLRETLLSRPFELRRLPGCYAPGAANRIAQAHAAGRENRTLDLHRLLTLESIDRLLLAPPCRT